MTPSGAIDQLGVDTDLIIRPLHTSFQDILYTKFLAHFLNFDGFAFVSEYRVARDDEQFAELGEVRNDIFGNSVAEIVLIWVTTQVFERKYRNRGYCWCFDSPFGYVAGWAEIFTPENYCAHGQQQEQRDS